MTRAAQCGAILWAGLCLSGAGRVLPAQTLARPGWAGSGLTVSEWWRSAVIFEVSPHPDASGAVAPALVSSPPAPAGGVAAASGTVVGSSPAAELGGAPTELTDLAGELDDLQTLGADAILLRGIDRGTTGSGALGRVAEQYGTLDQFDTLLQAASQRRIRVLVELPATLEGDALSGAARFWLSRGVSGLALGSSVVAGASTGATSVSGTAAPTPAQTPVAEGSMASSAAPASTMSSGAPAADAHLGTQAALLHEVLRGYIGGRILLLDAAAGEHTGSGPELVLTTILGFPSGPIGQPVNVTAVRESLAAAARSAAAGGRRGGSAAGIDPRAPSVVGSAAEARVSVLLMVAGGVLLRAGEVGAGPGTQAVEAAKLQREKDLAAFAAATSPAGVSNVKRAIAARAAAEPPRFAGDAVFRWTERMVGLHRGNPSMLLGTQELLDYDKDGAVVSVWHGRGGQVLCELVNMRDTPVELSLAQQFTAMHERGSFLRPVARTDAGMGAMPLGRVKLPAFGVFLGELGR